jgi:hypothetical protein
VCLVLFLDIIHVNAQMAADLASALRRVRVSRVEAVSAALPVRDALRLSGCICTRRTGVKTELQEVFDGAPLPPKEPHGEMLSIDPATNMQRPNYAWPSACGPALAHPGLAAASRIVRAHGARLSLDTSLHAEALAHIGGYFNASRATVAIAVDSSWSELIHELTHVRFHTRVRLGGGGAADPLRTHWCALRERGFSEIAAEEMVCRHHELQALCAAGQQPWAQRAAALLVWDSALMQAVQDIASIPTPDRTDEQKRELRRMLAIRLFIGARARVMYVIVAGSVVITSLSALLRRTWQAAQAEGRRVEERA